ncbi:MAG: twin-arginine translocase subunit TatC [Bacteroidetes bacterium]|nr:twin-arginine translocase subunit TatC [Bacteroidota bacterium]
MIQGRLDQIEEDNEMSFLEHLEVLRWHLVRSAIAVIIITIIIFIKLELLFGVLLAPSKADFWTYRMMCKYFGMCVKDIGFTLQNTEMAGQFSQAISTSVSFGIVLSFPYIAWELWRFFKPALKSKERNYAKGIVFFSSILFFCGLLLGYYFISPITIQFLGGFVVSDLVINRIDLGSYMDTIIMMSLSTALVFELPMVVYFLSVAGILTPKPMRKYRRHAVVVSFIASAIITPSTDMTSMLALAIPFVFLYELSIFVSAFVYRKRLKKQKLEE